MNVFSIVCWYILTFKNVIALGFAGWLSGLIINIHSDNILRILRKPGETGYKIPRGE